MGVNKATGAKLGVGQIVSRWGTGFVPFATFSNLKSTALNIVATPLPETAVMVDCYVKITAITSATGNISVGLATVAGSSSVASAFIANLVCATTGVLLATCSTSAASIQTYGSLLLNAGLTQFSLKTYAIGNASYAGRYLSYNLDSTGVTMSGAIYPIWADLA
jgi:hypothetical protein